MLDSKLQQLRDRFGIFQLTDWQSVEPAWILAQDGCGPKTLDYIRVLLANHGFTLKNDRTPEFWKQHYKDVRILETLGDLDEGSDRGVICPFVVYIDPAEQLPFTFQGMRCDADQEYRPLVVTTERRSLGRHPNSLGDYTIDSAIGRCHVERKSENDARSTILGWNSGGRERFECELRNLSEIQAPLVIIECGYESLLMNARATDSRSAQENAKNLHRSMVALIQDYRVPFMLAGTRRLAEKFTFDWFRRFHEKQVEAAKQESRRLKRLAAPVKQEQPVKVPESVASLF